MLDLAPHSETIARALFGDPNPHHSSSGELRFGSNGSLSIKITGEYAGTYRNHEKENGGSIYDLVKQEKGDKTKEWLDRTIGSYEPTQKSNIKKVYEYCDENGALIFEAVRLEPKSFRQRRKDNGEYIWNLKGINSHIPYRLPEILEAIASEKAIYIVEGEKDADLLWKMNIPATCNAGGAGKWTKDHSKYFRDAHVIIIPDNDEAGAKHAQSVGVSLKGIADEINLMELNGLQQKGDISDWFNKGNSVEDFYKLASVAPKFMVAKNSSLIFFDDDKLPPPPSWLVKDIISQDALSMVYAPSGVGKTFLALDLSHAIASGRNWFDQCTSGLPVLYIASEGQHGIRKRVAAIKQKYPDYKNVPLAILPASLNFHEDHQKPLDEITKLFADCSEAFGESPKLVVLDTLSRAMLGGVDSDPRDMKRTLDNVERARRELGVHIMLIHHTSKDKSLGMRGSSIAFDYADTIIQLSKDEETEDLEAKIVKQKDGADGTRYRFQLQPVTLPSNDPTIEVTSQVVEFAGALSGNEVDKKPVLNQRETKALECLKELIESSPVTPVTGCNNPNVTNVAVKTDTWRNMFFQTEGLEGNSRRMIWKRVKNNLLQKGVVIENGELSWIP